MTLRQFAERYGPTGAIILVLALLVALLPGNAKDTNTTTTAGDRAASALGQDVAPGVTDVASEGGAAVEGGATGAAGTRAGVNRGALAPSSVVKALADVVFGQGPNCRADGRNKGVSRYMPPCALWQSRDNGGVTGRGVTKEKVLIIRYVNQINPATEAILVGARLADEPETVTAAYKAMFRYANTHYETYGRELVYQEYAASGPDENDEQLRNDAAKIATELKPFAVFTLGPKVFAQEIAQRGVICICTVSLSSEFYKSNPPHMFGTLPTSDEYAGQLSEYIGKRLARKPAKFAGDEINPTQGLRTRERKFGLIYLEGLYKVDPEGKRSRDNLVRELAKYDVKLTKEVGYIYDPGRNQQDVTNMIAQMNDAGVTSIIMFVEPLYPILITREATRQQYFPEWIISGSGLSDTTAAGRLYDQVQWRHTFGISPLWVTWSTVARSPGYRETHHGNPAMRPGDEGILINIYREFVQTLFIGVHLAGPKLTSDTFARGMFSYPKTGGVPSAPLVFRTREFPTAIKDFIEVFYDWQRQGVDERGESGPGMLMKMSGGKRFLPGQWPATDTAAFNDPTALTTSDNPPGGFDPDHEQDGHTHPAAQKCLSC